MKSDEVVEVDIALLMNVLHTMSYAEGYLSGIGKSDIYISEQTNCVISDIMSLFEKKKESPARTF